MNRFCRILVAAVFLAQMPGSVARAQGSAQGNESLFRPGDAAYPVLIGAGLAVLLPRDRQIAESMQDSALQSNSRLRTTSRVFRLLGAPGSVVLSATAFGLGRVAGNDQLARIGLRSSEAVLAGSVIGFIVKGAAGRARPFAVGDSLPADFQFGRGYLGGRERQSFPSGHTLAAFAAASAVTGEWSRTNGSARWFAGVPLYTAASLVGLSRLYNDQHWASDVWGGAVLGVFVGTKIVRYHKLHPGNRLDRKLLNARVTIQF